MIDSESIARLALFADLSKPELEAIAHTLDEQVFPRDERVLRQGMSGLGLFFVLDGEASVRIDGQEVARLGRGEFFGEASVLLGEPPFADVVAAAEMLRCAVVHGPDVEAFLLRYPHVMYRMLQTQSRRLRGASLWEG
jgi:CRP-like cAMP-binding protein